MLPDESRVILGR